MSLIKIFWLQNLEPIIELCKFFKLKNPLLMLMALFMFSKVWKLTIKKTFGYIINNYFKFSKNLDKVYDDLKDWA